MAKLSSEHNPSFILLPVNNNRTGWRPFGLPVVLVVPHRRTVTGVPLNNSQVFNIKIYIEDVPRRAKVAGHDHVGLFSPDRELYTVNIDSKGLSDRQIRVSDYDIYRSDTIIDQDIAKNGDAFVFTTSTGLTDRIPYLQGANYYDLSDINIDFEHLPSDLYNLVYQVEYFTRIISDDSRQEFLCIDTKSTSLALLKFKVKHPGAVIEEFERLTPAPYLTNANRSDDTTLAIYRPFTDSLENIYDEQELLESINWVYETPPEAIPYLSQLLGWDIPYFPESLDGLRKAVLRRTVEFQKLTGSKRALIELFRLFGFEILINNLWWSSDGKKLIRPDEKQDFGYQDQEITTLKIDQIEAVVADWSGKGFGQFTAPLLFRPQTQPIISQYTALLDGGDVTVESYLVENGSPAYIRLTQIVEQIKADPFLYGSKSGGLTQDADGYYISQGISQQMQGLDILGHSKCLISGKFGQATKQTSTGTAPIGVHGLNLNRGTNKLNLTLDGDLGLGNQSVFSFAYYRRYDYSVPDSIKDLQSNRFDVQIVTQELTEFADPVVLDFALEFLDKIKAFHSLLNKVISTTELNETYAVTDWCLGGEYTQRWDTDAGRLQVPPAIIPDLPNDITECSKLDPKTLGYKASDIRLRLRVLASLPIEHAGWSALDTRTDQPSGTSRLPLTLSAPNRVDCKYNYVGQDRIVGTRVDSRTYSIEPTPNSNSMQAGVYSNAQESPVDQASNGLFDGTGASTSSNSDSSIYGAITKESSLIRQPLCELDQTTDYCYKGRVDDQVLYRPTLLLSENLVLRPCNLDMGIGVYYTYPSYSQVVVNGVGKPGNNSLTPRIVYSGGATTGGIQPHLDSIQHDYLTSPYDSPLNRDSMLTRLYRDFGNPQDFTLHYNDRITGDFDQRSQLALARPSLNIEKPTLHFPGCRFATLYALQHDFYHPEWSARPWDDDFSSHCGPRNICGNNEPDYLHCYKTVATDGNEYLVFDQRPFQALGNGLIADVSSLGTHTLTNNMLPTDVVHQVYMCDADKGHECLELDSVCAYDTLVAEGTLQVAKPVFSSYAQCGTSVIDYADGYACTYGYKQYMGEDMTRSGLFEEVLSGLGVNVTIGTESGRELLFFLGSGLLVEGGIRLDCGCLLTPCGTMSEGPTICSANTFIDDLGNYDWDMAHAQVLPSMLLSEPIGTSSFHLDGSIKSLLEVV